MVLPHTRVGVGNLGSFPRRVSVGNFRYIGEPGDESLVFYEVCWQADSEKYHTFVEKGCEETPTPPNGSGFEVVFLQ